MSQSYICFYANIFRWETVVSFDRVWCGVVWRGVAWCGVVWRGVVWCGVARCSMILWGAMWRGFWSTYACLQVTCTTHQVVVKCEDIVKLTKGKTARVIPNAIQITTRYAVPSLIINFSPFISLINILLLILCFKVSQLIFNIYI